jgi:LytS/YehU family sensor histidine kinase
MFESRRLLFSALGLGEYRWGDMKVRYFMEGAEDVRGYLGMLTLIFLYHYFRYSAQQELARARLETLLAQAQLQNLRLQLEPHFLFNALNAISAVVYESPRKADEMISRLSDLLRHLLKQDHEQEIPLAEEIELVRLYTNVMQARLEDRLKVEIDVAAGTERALVPQLLLQPIVENAIKYGASPVTFQVEVQVTARLENGDLRITVRDHGPGFPKSGAESIGIGIRNTEERLSQLYGPRRLFERSDPDGGGTQVDIRVPFHTETRPMSEPASKTP